MFLVAITGGIASGKSTVSNILIQLGCHVIDADKIARQVVEPGQRAWRKIKQHFGDGVFHSDGTLDRDKLGQIVFSDSSKRALLSAITHPEIYRCIVWQLLKCLVQGERFVVLDLPLLFESGKMLPYINTIIVVYCSPSVQLQRLCSRSGLDEIAAQQRIDAQMSLKEKCRRATIVLENMSSVDELEVKVRETYIMLQSSKAYWKFRVIAGFILTVTLTSVVCVTQRVWSFVFSKLS